MSTGCQTMDVTDYHAENLLKKFGIPLHHLDFAYVDHCNDGNELEKIYQILKSGQEGYYPDLLRATENRMAQIKPNSRFLRKPTPVLTKSDVDADELKIISQDFNEWLTDMKRCSKEIEAAKNMSVIPKDLPDIRKTSVNLVENSSKAKRIASTDYNAWDKFDVDTEILKMDLEDEKIRNKATIPEQGAKKSVKFGPFSTKAESIFEANQEKQKGNECFKAGEYTDALEHYTNSIACFPTAAAYTNRAVVNLKLKNYQKTIANCEAALMLERNNFKANLRMAQAYEAMNKPNDAWKFAEEAVRIDPNNSLGQELAERLRPKNNQARNVRLKITETEDFKAVAGSSRMQNPQLEAARPFFLLSLDADDDGECLEPHGNYTLKNYITVDNRRAKKIQEAKSPDHFSDFSKSKVDNNSRAKIKNKRKVKETAERNGSGAGEPYINKSLLEIPEELHMPYTFLKTWQSVKKDGTYLGFAAILRSLNMERLPEVIGNKIDATILSDIINCLHRHFSIPDEVQKIYDTLINLCKVDRFLIAVMFLSAKDKQLARNLVDFLNQHGNSLPDDVAIQYMQ